MFVGRGYYKQVPNSTPAECFSRLLTHGYLPKELPPCFSSEAVGKHVFDNWAELRDDKTWTQPASLNLARYGGLRRRVSVPNLRSFARLAVELSDIQSWERDAPWEIWTKSWPIVSAGPRAFEPTHKPAELNRLFNEYRSRGSIAVVADVSQFYSSIYTHAISWAMHSKPVAKRNLNSRPRIKLAGDRIDELAAACQNGQTQGIAIGPDTSFIISEIVLNAVDQALQSTGQMVGFRYFDDYELVFENRTDAESMLNELESVLHDFGLQLNPLKTRIIELPVELNAAPLFRLRKFQFDASASEADLMAYFDEVLRLRNDFPRSDVIHYAIGHLATINFDDDVWQSMQHMLVQLVRVEPSAFENLARLLVKQKLKDNALAPIMERFLYRSIIENVRKGRDSEVTWALWLSSVFELALTPAVVDAVVTSSNSFVALLALHEWPTLFTAEVTEKWRSFGNEPDACKNENWLLSFYFNRNTPLFSFFPKDKTFFVEEHKGDAQLTAWLGQPQWTPYV